MSKPEVFSLLLDMTSHLWSGCSDLCSIESNGETGPAGQTNYGKRLLQHIEFGLLLCNDAELQKSMTA